MTTEDKLISESNKVLSEHSEEPMSFKEFVEELLENPELAAKSSQYLLNAIEYFGRRTVIEEGEQKQRWQFFDDPANNGEHAVLGNTETLNRFVDRLRQISNTDADMEDKILWFDGPTATGKSEFKRCLVNGLKAYSKTDEGRRYTIEWNINTREGDTAGVAYADTTTADREEHWWESPVQTNPFSVFPEEVRKELAAEFDETSVPEEVGIDPFSDEAFQILKSHYESTGENGELFEKITDPKHLRISRYQVDEGKGVGVLHSEDEGNPKQRLVGSWMPQMLGQLESRGRKNPQAFSYDGLIPQANSGLAVVEEASQHADLLQKLLNVPDENYIKLDQRIPFDIDTMFIILSNPDLAAQLNQHQDSPADPLKALKRRLEKYRFKYLLSIGSETELLRRELLDEREVWTDNHDEKIRKPATIDNTKLAPHTLESAALYSVVTRLDKTDLNELDLVEKALLYEYGYYEDEDGKNIEIEDTEIEDENNDGEAGIPVTYTRDVILSLDEEVAVPQDLLEVMQENLSTDPVFSDAQVDEYEERVEQVAEYILEQQETDVIQAALRDRHADEDTVRTYIDHVYAWADESNNDDDDMPDPLKMKVFEKKHLGFTGSDYDGTEPSNEVEEFRMEKIMMALNKHLWKNKDGEFKARDIPLAEIPVLEELLGSYGWDDVADKYDDFDPDRWDDASEGTDTGEMKEAVIKNLQDMFEYTEEGARKTARYVMNEVSKEQWD